MMDYRLDISRTRGMVRNCLSEDDFFAYHPTQYDLDHPWTSWRVLLENEEEENSPSLENYL